MKILTSAGFCESDGRPIFQFDVIQNMGANGQISNIPVKTNKRVTFKSTVVQSLMISDADLKDANEKAERFALGIKIQSADEIELTPEEMVLIKKVVNKNQSIPTLVFGQICELMKGNVAIKEVAEEPILEISGPEAK